MKIRTLGNGLEVSALGLGCMSMTSCLRASRRQSHHDQADSFGP